MGTKAFRDKVRFYEDNKSHIVNLDYEERIDVELDYALCLFEIGKYHKFLSKADSLIEVVITDNIFEYNGLNIYNDLLFKKGACLFNTGQYTKSEKILKAVAKLEPENNIVRILYGKCKRKQSRNWFDGVNVVAVFFLITAVVLSVIELLVIQQFYEEHLSRLFNVKLFCFGASIFTLAASEVYLQYVIGKEIGYKFEFKNFWRGISK